MFENFFLILTYEDESKIRYLFTEVIKKPLRKIKTRNAKFHQVEREIALHILLWDGNWSVFSGVEKLNQCTDIL